ncbi:MAG: helix-turn-helix transcriptional regulator [Clostridiales bacterium]|nr:helix-turn-helix transcriptional regulator [Clostridiales bacterium]
MENKYMIAFAKNLKELIGNMTVSEFARKIDIPQQTLSRYLLCQREITLQNLCKIADYFNEDIDILLGRKEY